MLGDKPIWNHQPRRWHEKPPHCEGVSAYSDISGHAMMNVSHNCSICDTIAAAITQAKPMDPQQNAGDQTTLRFGS
jgi:hypothetical protein